MPVERYENPLRYFVTSSSRAIKHLVELDALDGNGQCTCEDFKYNRAQLLAAPYNQKPSEATRCKHIKEARDALCDSIIEKLAKIQNGETKDDSASTAGGMGGEHAPLSSEESPQVAQVAPLQNEKVSARTSRRGPGMEKKIPPEKKKERTNVQGARKSSK
jgi:hypothetical protein